MRKAHGGFDLLTRDSPWIDSLSGSGLDHCNRRLRRGVEVRIVVVRYCYLSPRPSGLSSVMRGH